MNWRSVNHGVAHTGGKEVGRIRVGRISIRRLMVSAGLEVNYDDMSTPIMIVGQSNVQQISFEAQKLESCAAGP